MEVNQRGLVAPIGDVVLCSRPEAALDPLAEAEVLGTHRVHGKLQFAAQCWRALSVAGALGDVEGEVTVAESGASLGNMRHISTWSAWWMNTVFGKSV